MGSADGTKCWRRSAFSGISSHQWIGRPGSRGDDQQLIPRGRAGRGSRLAGGIPDVFLAMADPVGEAVDSRAEDDDVRATDYPAAVISGEHVFGAGLVAGAKLGLGLLPVCDRE